MFTKKLLFITILNLYCFSMRSQTTIASSKMEIIKVVCDVFLGFDNQQNSYTITNNILTKTNQTSTYQYNNLGLGKITKVEIQNPLQIVVFYKNFNTVVLLDNQLNEIKKIDFNLKSTPVNLDAVALSSQN